MNLRSDLKVELIDSMGNWQDVVKSARYSTTMDLKGEEKDLRLLRRLWRDQHLSPFEAVETVWHVEAPIFVARQWMRHRTWSYNEFSQRYSKSKLEFYVPDTAERPHFEAVYERAAADYEWMLNNTDVDRETARMLLPLGTFTYFRGKTNFRNLIAFLKLRTAEDVQPETRQLALRMVDLMREKMPELMEVCWDDSREPSTS